MLSHPSISHQNPTDGISRRVMDLENESRQIGVLAHSVYDEIANASVWEAWGIMHSRKDVRRELLSWPHVIIYNRRIQPI